MRKHICKLLVMLFLCIVCGCETVTVIDLPKDEPRIVLNSLLQPDSLLIVNLSRTSTTNLANYYYDNEDYINSFYLDDAEIKVYIDDAYKGVMQKAAEKGKYSIPATYVSAGQRIVLQAYVEDYLPVTAQTVLLAPPMDLNVEITPDSSSKKPDSDNRYDVEITFTDDGNNKNYYLLKITCKEGYEVDGEKVVNFYSTYMRDRGNLLLDHEDTFVLSPYFYFDPNGFYSYYYLSGSQNYIFTDDLFKGSEYTLRFQLSNNWNSFNADSLNYTLTQTTELCNISESYYLYLRSKAIQFEQGDFFGEIGLREPMPTYTNVTGGYGIVGSQAKQVREVVISASESASQIYR